MNDQEDKGEDFQQINPEDYYGYEERFVEKGGGGGGDSKKEQQGRKTIQALRRTQRRQSRERRRSAAETALKNVISQFPGDDNPDLQERILSCYLDWINAHLQSTPELDEAELEILRAKSGGPGGQHVNKRETRVMVIHLPTGLRAESDQTRSQRKNRSLAEEQLRKKLAQHLANWRSYLSTGEFLKKETLLEMLEDHSG
jgi:hypothetical protein